MSEEKQAGRRIPILPPMTAKMRTLRVLLEQFARENPSWSDERVYIAARMQAEWVYPIAKQIRELDPKNDPMRYGLRPFTAADAAREWREKNAAAQAAQAG